MRDSFSVVLPYYNEAAYLPATLASWMQQTRLPEQLILVNNGSTDGSDALCRSVLKGRSGLEILFGDEPRPGKIHALEKGCALVRSTFIVLADADTIYPPHYLSLSASLAAHLPPGIVALMAIPVYRPPGALASRLKRRALVTLSRLLRKRIFTGGYGQILRADIYRKAGGFSERLWPYVLLDHEILHRMFRYGDSLYHADLWCSPSLRRKDRRSVRWNLLERTLYHAVPFQLKDWFFYRFLGPRFAARGLFSLNLREQPWKTPRESPPGTD
jgi:glycosyltransferase involved in cell wall biosynthesis